MRQKQVNPLLIIMLALGVFGIITTEMGIVGVLPQVARKFNITASQAGTLVSVFAIVVAISGPFLTLLASGINRKVILLIAVFMFAVSNIVYAMTSKFEVMLAFRIIPACFHPVFFPWLWSLRPSWFHLRRAVKRSRRYLPGLRSDLHLVCL